LEDGLREQKVEKVRKKKGRARFQAQKGVGEGTGGWPAASSPGQKQRVFHKIDKIKQTQNASTGREGEEKKKNKRLLECDPI